MRFLARLITTLIALGSILWCQAQHLHQLTEEEIGSVRFPTTCSKSTEASFSLAVALLHSFQYELARNAFMDISREDQNCAMAYWGVGMSYYNGFANSLDLDDGRRALQKAQQLATASKTTSAREKDYVNALAEIYRDGADSSARAEGFEQKMRALQTAYPGDTEAALFHALALGITAQRRTDRTYANQRECGNILEPIFREISTPPRSRSLFNPLLRQSCARGKRSGRRSRLRKDRSSILPRAPHALAHLHSVGVVG